MIIINISNENISDSYIFDIIAQKLDKYVNIDLAPHVAIWNQYDDDIMILNNQLDYSMIQYIDDLAELIQQYDIIYLTGYNNIVFETLQCYVISKSFINKLFKFMSDIIYNSEVLFPNFSSLKYKTPLMESQFHLFNNYRYYHNCDSVSGDIGLFPNKSINDLISICNSDIQYTAFNTLGYIKHTLNKMIEYPNGGLYVKQNDKIIAERVHNILNRSQTQDVTFVVTTCKRWDFFKKTMDSLLLACDDLSIIKEFICIDDNSSIDDRLKMKIHYPFFNFILKNEDQKGHQKSLNIVWDLIKTEYVFHFEDDWLCHESFSFQYIFNTIVSFNIDHILLRKNCLGTYPLFFNRLYQYVYNPKHYLKPFDNKLYDIEFMNKHNINAETFYDNNNENVDTHWWWPGFSLNPCVFNFYKYKKIGLFDETIQNDLFEYDFALRSYFNKLNTYFIDYNIQHIGEISSYSLNKTNRSYDPIL